jgi:hypothetical protein
MYFGGTGWQADIVKCRLNFSGDSRRTPKFVPGFFDSSTQRACTSLALPSGGIDRNQIPRKASFLFFSSFLFLLFQNCSH